MNRIQTQSSNIRSAGFEDGILEIEFKQGSVYQYAPVSEKQYHDFLIAESKSKWINENIKKNSSIKFKKI